MPNEFEALHHYPEPVAPLTRLEVEAAIMKQRAIMLRAPKVMHERYSAQLDALLDQWETARLEETYTELPGA